LVPTWRAWILFLVLLTGLFFLGRRFAYPFLAFNQPVSAEFLVVEGWAPKYALDQAVGEFHRGHYRTLFVTGGVIEEGSIFSDYKTYANLGATSLLKAGFPAESLQAVPAELVKKDRTYTSALALKQWMTAHGGIPPSFNVVSLGTHSRRTHLLFSMAFEKQAQIGMIAVVNRDYDPSRWWQYSQGVRSIIDEAIAYTYARFCFRPARG
jgi:hypothetical protein